MSSSAIYVSEVPVLSTAHVCATTMDLLLSGPTETPFGMVCTYPEGCFILFVAEDTMPTETPADLADLHRWLQKQPYHWCRLDADGDIVNGLPVYDW
ncbi:MAG: hypothetical protein Q8J78_17370 [Moraxellaceae bacterium]|nr:hypothetical protein [Moraxellaceae bacterium]